MLAVATSVRGYNRKSITYKGNRITVYAQSRARNLVTLLNPGSWSVLTIKVGVGEGQILPQITTKEQSFSFNEITVC